ncbi:MAG: hypothetical protein H6850_02000 [Alphaproteobacteria bacterium]|nr:MAG: hypothetical protein H6850_02000 [Alphaproteobacteria bacterium]
MVNVYFYTPLELTTGSAIALSQGQSLATTGVQVFTGPLNVPFVTFSNTVNAIANTFRTSNANSLNVDTKTTDDIFLDAVLSVETNLLLGGTIAATMPTGGAGAAAAIAIIETLLAGGDDVAAEAVALLAGATDLVEIAAGIAQAKVVIAATQPVIVAQVPTFSRDQAVWSGIALMSSALKFSNVPFNTNGIDLLPFSAFPYS